MKIQAVPVKKSQEQEIQALTVQTQNALKNSSKELTDAEKLVIKSSEKLPVSKYSIIYPMQGTIGRMTRYMDGGNHQAIELVRAGIPPMSMKTGNNHLVDLIREFDGLDELSQNRIDCLDHLARKHSIGIMRFLDAMAEGLDFVSRKETAMIVAAKRPDLAQKILKSAENESLKSVAHKKLAANIAGLEQQAGALVEVNTGTRVTKNTTINQNVVLDFSDFTKQQAKLIRGEKEDYVDGELVEEEAS